ncbi:MAG: efflux RND transporter periplasmic adaptor subunit [Roseivirga sp.]|nr:efflux RND transporter periplasmic adaptor subunit [Roseivirga sp.]
MTKTLFVISTAALLLMGCQQQKTPIEEPDVESLRQEVKPTEITVAQATFRPFEFRVNSSGTIDSENELKVTFQTNGYLEKLLIRNGQRVRKGQLIAELQNDKEELAKEKAEVALAKAQLDFQYDSIARSNSQDPVVDRNLRLKTGLKTAELSIKEAEFNLNNTFVYAPINGIMAEIEEKQGNIVSSGKELGVIYDPDNLVLTGKVLETDFKHISIGLEVDIFPLSFKDRAFRANVVEFNPKVDENGMVEVKMKLKETQGLLPGMNANAIIRVPQKENIIVPREALVIKSGRPVVFTYQNGLAKWNYVELGLDNGVDLEILSGIEPDSQVITSNNMQLAHDARVSVANGSLNNN